jgi:hypothetical protein
MESFIAPLRRCNVSPHNKGLIFCTQMLKKIREGGLAGIHDYASSINI